MADREAGGARGFDRRRRGSVAGVAHHALAPPAEESATTAATAPSVGSRVGRAVRFAASQAHRARAFRGAFRPALGHGAQVSWRSLRLRWARVDDARDFGLVA